MNRRPVRHYTLGIQPAEPYLDMLRARAEEAERVLARTAAIDAHPEVTQRGVLYDARPEFAGSVVQFADPYGITGWIGHHEDPDPGMSPWHVATGFRRGDQVYARHDTHPGSADDLASAITEVLDKTRAVLPA